MTHGVWSSPVTSKLLLEVGKGNLSDGDVRARLVADLVGDLERYRDDRPGLISQGGARQQDQVGAAAQPANNFRRHLFTRKLPEKLFDVLDFEGALLELVLGDVMFHYCRCSILAQVSRSDTVRLNTIADGEASRSTQK